MPPSTGQRPAKTASDKNAGEPIPDVLIRINVRLVVISVGIVAILLASVHFVHSRQLRRNALHFVELADSAEADGDLGSAIKHLSVYLSFLRESSGTSDAELLDTIDRLANLHVQRSAGFDDSQRAYYYFEELLRADSGRVDSRVKLVDVAMTLGRYRDARFHIESLLNAEADNAGENDVLSRQVLLGKLARCQVALRQIPEAQQTLCQRIIADQQHCESYTDLAAIVAAYPAQVITRAEAAAVAPTTDVAISLAFPAGDVADGPAALKSIDSILDLMVEQGQPRWDALRRRALLLSTGQSIPESAATSRSAARIQAAELIVALDQDQDGVLNRQESDDPQVPAFTDTNGDASIDQSELVARLSTAGYRVRLNKALSSIESALQLVSADENAEGKLPTHKTAIDVLLSLAETLQHKEPATAREYVVRARSHAAIVAELDEVSPDALLAQAQLELRTLGFESDADVQQQRLDDAESLLRNSLQILTASESEGTGDPQESSTPLSIVVMWTLADVLIYQLENKPENAAALRRELTLTRKVDGQDIKTGIFSDLDDADASPALIKFLEGRLELVNRQWKKADDAFRIAATGVGQTSDFARRLTLLRAHCAAALGNPDAQLEHTLSLIKADPTWGPARVAHAQAYVNAGRIDEAINEYADLAGHPQYFEYYIRLLLTREIDKPFDRRNWRTIEKAIGELEQQHGKSHDSVIVRAELLFQQAVTYQLAYQAARRDGLSDQAAQHLKEADRVLRAAVDETPDEVDLWVALVEFLVRKFDLPPDERISLCQEVLQNAMNQIGDQVAIRQAAAMAAVLQPEEMALPSLIELLRPNEEFTDAERAELLRSVAEAYIRLDEPGLAFELYAEAAGLKPSDISIPTTALHHMVEQMRDRNGSLGEEKPSWDSMLDHLKSIEGDGGPFTAYFTAAYAIHGSRSGGERSNELSTAREQLIRAERRKPSWKAIPRLLGELHLLQEDNEQAAAYFRRAFELGERDSSVLHVLAQDYLERGDDRTALYLFDQVAEEQPHLLQGDLGRLAFSMSRSFEEGSRTLGIIRSHATGSADADDKIFLALDRILRGKTDAETERLLILATRLGPENPNTWLFLVRYYAQLQDIQSALKTINDAGARLPEDPPLIRPMTLARSYDALINVGGDRAEEFRDQARTLYTEAIQIEPDNVGIKLVLADFYSRQANFDEALKVVDAVLSPQSAATDGQRIIARRVHALLLGYSGEPVKALSALKQLVADTSPQNSVNVVANLRAELSILERQNRNSNRHRMVQLLDQIRSMPEARLTLAESIRRARLYEEVDDWQKSSEAFRAAIKDFPDENALVVDYALGLLERVEQDSEGFREIEELVSRLKAREPDSLRTAIVLSRFLRKQGEEAEAANVLTEHSRAFRFPRPDDTLRRMIEESDADQATGLLEASLRTNGNNDSAILGIVETLRRQIVRGQTETAIQILKRYISTADVAADLTARTHLIIAKELEDNHHIEAAEQEYRSFVAASRQSEATLELVGFLGRQQRIDEALDLCESVWDRLASPARAAQYSVAVLRDAQPSNSQFVRVEKRILSAMTTSSDPEQLLEYQIWLADLLDAQQRFDEEIKVFEQLISAGVSQPRVLNNFAWLLAFQEGREPQGLGLIEHAIRTWGPRADFLDTQGMLYLQLQQTDAAERCFAEAIATAGNEPLTWLHLAISRQRAGDISKAREALVMAELSGLSIDMLHPLETDAYASLIKELGHKP